MKIDIGLTALWGAVSGTALACLWLFTNIAWAADVEAIEVRLLKQEIREIRREMRDHPHDEEVLDYLKRDLQEVIDELCIIRPDDRECNG